MRLKVKKQEQNLHEDIVTSVGFNSADELYR